MTKEEQFVNELIGYIFAYPDDDYMTMECLCRKLVKHGLLDKVDGYYQTHEIRTNTHECVKDTHDKTEPTISKMEQVEDEPQTCDNCKLKGSTKWCNNQVVCRAYKPMDEPQTEPLHTCSVNGRPYSECSSCEHFKCTADEPQTDCPWK